MLGGLEKHWLRGRGILGGLSEGIQNYNLSQSFGTQGAQPFRPVICGK